MIQNTNPIPTAPETKRKFGKRSIKLLLTVGFGIVFVALGFIGWKLSQPEVREVKLDLKNGYTLLMELPAEWKIDEITPSPRVTKIDISKPKEKIKSFNLYFKRSELTGIRKWIETRLYGELNPFDNISQIQVYCECDPLKDDYDPRAKRYQDMTRFQSLVKANDRNIKKGTFPSMNTVVSKYDYAKIGNGFEIRTEPIVKGEQKFAGGTIKLSTMDQIFIYSVTPDKKQTVFIHLFTIFPSEGEKVTSSAKNLLAASLKFIPSNSNSK